MSQKVASRTKPKAKRGYTLAERVIIIGVVFFAGVAVFLISSARCTMLDQLAQSKLQTLNTGYNSFLAVGGTPILDNGEQAAKDAVSAMRLRVNGLGPFISREEDAILEFTACDGGEIVIVLSGGKFVAEVRPKK